MKKYGAIIMALAAALLFGVAAPFSKTLLNDLRPNLLAGLLYLGASVGMLPWIVWQLRSGRTIIPPQKRNRGRLLGAVIFGGGIAPVLLLIGLKAAMAASVSMWLNLEVVATAVLGVLFFHEHLGKWTWLANAGVVLAGVLISYDSGWAGAIGLLCVSGAAIAWGLDNNFTAVIDDITPEDITFWKGLIAGTTNLLIGLTLFDWHWSWSFAWTLLLGAGSYGLSVALYIKAARGIGAARAQMVFASSPFFGVVMALIWLNERLAPLQIVAAGILVASIVLLLLDSHEHEHTHEPVTHEHPHRHDDGHHTHVHVPPVMGTHTHAHTHERITHRHPHWPDLHHRHKHSH